MASPSPQADSLVQRAARKPLLFIILALIAWCGLQVTGVLLGEYNQYDQFGRTQPSNFIARYKALIVAGSMASFLGMWLLALWFRSRRS